MPTETVARDLPSSSLPSVMVLQSRIHTLDWETTVNVITDWAAKRESRYVCLCNVHSIVTAVNDLDLCSALAGADLALPDGMPVARAAGWFARSDQPRIAGPDLMWRVCEEAARRRQAVFLLGSTEATLASLVERLRRDIPSLNVVGHHAPPFGPASNELDGEAVQSINRSGASLVFVGLGCPKQERWMAAHRGAVQAVMLGVGAAFDFHAGTVARAPRWMQYSGLEWLHRLCSDPRRLWKRYLTTNALFAWKLGRQDLRGPRAGLGCHRTATEARDEPADVGRRRL